MIIFNNVAKNVNYSKRMIDAFINKMLSKEIHPRIIFHLVPYLFYYYYYYLIIHLISDHYY